MSLDNSSEKHMSRRKALAIITTAAFGTGLALGIKTGKPSDIEIESTVIDKEKSDDLGLGELGKTRFEYFSKWPNPRVWVIVNNLLAAEKLDGLKLKKDQTYSLIDLLDLKKSYKDNLDPQNGYIMGAPVKSSPPFLTLVEAHGISLATTTLARALALSPVHINEWNTHSSVDRLMKDYFDAKNQYAGHNIFTQYGTDASVFAGDTFTLDFKFTPLRDLTLKLRIRNYDGSQLSLPKMGDILKKYAQSPAYSLTTPILIRAAVGTGTVSGHAVGLVPTVSEEYSGRKRPGFVREVAMGGENYREKFQALYDTNGNYMP